MDPRSVESRADRFADGSGVGGEIKEESRMTPEMGKTVGG